MKPVLLVLAAGMGSRYGGIKQIDPVGAHGETLLDYSCYDALKSGFGKVVFVIRPDIEADFREHVFDRISRNADAEYVFQTRESLLTSKQAELSAGRVKPWGTVQAVLCAKEALDVPFAIINADDYYGREAFSILDGYLSGLAADSTEHAMVGYILKNTMSPVGTVSRGVCAVKDGLLTGLEENKEIEFKGDRVVSHKPSGDVFLTGNETVSMNLFGFSPKAFESMGAYWNRFIEENAASEKAEAILANWIGEAVSSGEGSMRVFSTSERWFGMTYKEDRDTVKANLAKKTAEGFYPEKLWNY